MFNNSQLIDKANPLLYYSPYLCNNPPILSQQQISPSFLSFENQVGLGTQAISTSSSPFFQQINYPTQQQIQMQFLKPQQTLNLQSLLHSQFASNNQFNQIQQMNIQNNFNQQQYCLNQLQQSPQFLTNQVSNSSTKEQYKLILLNELLKVEQNQWQQQQINEMTQQQAYQLTINQQSKPSQPIPLLTNGVSNVEKQSKIIICTSSTSDGQDSKTVKLTPSISCGGSPNFQEEIKTAGNEASGIHESNEESDLEKKRQERKMKIEKYKNKRRNWLRKISYDCRKKVADSRLRIKGRFISKKDTQKIRELVGNNDEAFNEKKNLRLDFMNLKMNTQSIFLNPADSKNEILTQIEQLIVKNKEIHSQKIMKSILDRIKHKQQIFCLLSRRDAEIMNEASLSEEECKSNFSQATGK